MAKNSNAVAVHTLMASWQNKFFNTDEYENYRVSTYWSNPTILFTRVTRQQIIRIINVNIAVVILFQNKFRMFIASKVTVKKQE